MSGIIMFLGRGGFRGGGASDAVSPFFDKLLYDYLLGYKTKALNVSTTKKVNGCRNKQ